MTLHRPNLPPQAEEYEGKGYSLTVYPHHTGDFQGLQNAAYVTHKDHVAGCAYLAISSGYILSY